MEHSKEKDAEIGQDLFENLHRVITRLARRHGIPRDRAADYLLGSALFTAAGIYGLSIDDTLAVTQEIARSVQEDELESETRH